MLYNPYYSTCKLKNVPKLYAEFISKIKIGDNVCVQTGNSEIFGSVVRKNNKGLNILTKYNQIILFYSYRSVKYIMERV